MPGRPSKLRRREQPQRVPALAPGVADPLVRVEDHERPALLREVVAGGEPRLAAADDHRLERCSRSARRPSCSPSSLVRGDARTRPRGRIARIHQLARERAWSFLTTQRASDEVVLERERGRRRRATRRRACAKMFCRWRATVCSLTTSSAAISRLRLAGGDQAEHLELARASGRAYRRSAPPSARRAREVGRAPSSLEGVARRVELQRRALSSSPSARHASADRARAPARPRTARRAPATAATPGAAPSSAACGVALRELDRPRARAPRAPRASALSLAAAISASSSAARRAASASPAASMISTDAGSSAARCSGSSVSPSDAADRRRRGFDVSLREPQQREARLRLAAATGSPRGTPPRPRRTRPRGGAARPAGRAPARSPPGSSPARSARGPAAPPRARRATRRAAA